MVLKGGLESKLCLRYYLSQSTAAVLKVFDPPLSVLRTCVGHVKRSYDDVSASFSMQRQSPVLCMHCSPINSDWHISAAMFRFARITVDVSVSRRKKGCGGQ